MHISGVTELQTWVYVATGYQVITYIYFPQNNFRGKVLAFCLHCILTTLWDRPGWERVTGFMSEWRAEPESPPSCSIHSTIPCYAGSGNGSYKDVPENMMHKTCKPFTVPIVLFALFCTTSRQFLWKVICLSEDNSAQFVLECIQYCQSLTLVIQCFHTNISAPKYDVRIFSSKIALSCLCSHIGLCRPNVIYAIRRQQPGTKGLKPCTNLVNMAQVIPILQVHR